LAVRFSLNSTPNPKPCQGKEFRSTIRKNDRFPSWEETWRIKLPGDCGEQEYDSDADDLQVDIDLMDYAYGRNILVGRCVLSHHVLLAGSKQVMQMKKAHKVSLEVESVLGERLVNQSGIASQVHLTWRIARYRVDKNTSEHAGMWC
jgi:hypothetical protein